MTSNRRPFSPLQPSLLAIAMVLVAAACGEAIPDFASPRRALLVIDLQVDFLDPAGRLPVARDQVAPLLTATAALLQQAERDGDEVVYVVNRFDPADLIGNLFRNQAAIAGSPGAAIDPRVVQVNDQVFAKSAPDAFSNPALLDHLLAAQVGQLRVVGVFADQCVRATVEAAQARGFAVTVVADAVAAADAPTRQRALNDFAARGIEVTTSAALLADQE